MNPVRVALAAILLASSSASSAIGWSGPGYYVWAPSSTRWDSTKVIWSDRFDTYDSCLQQAGVLNQLLDSSRAADALFLFECHQLQSELRAVTAPEAAAVAHEIGKQ